MQPYDVDEEEARMIRERVIESVRAREIIDCRGFSPPTERLFA